MHTCKLSIVFRFVVFIVVGCHQGVFVGKLTAAGGTAHGVRVALLCLGEIGFARNLSGAVASIDTIVYGAFSHADDNVRGAAAFCFGNMAVGNVAEFLPKLLGLIRSTPGRQYLFLSALKECIVRTVAEPSKKVHWDFFFFHCVTCAYNMHRICVFHWQPCHCSGHGGRHCRRRGGPVV